MITAQRRGVPGTSLFLRLMTALTHAHRRVRAVLWHQCAADLLRENHAASYAAMLTKIIAASRESAGFKLP